MKVFVTSPSRGYKAVNAVISMMTNKEFTVTYDWTQDKASDNPIDMNKAYKLNASAIKDADAVVEIVSGSSPFESFGAPFWSGYAAALNKSVVIYFILESTLNPIPHPVWANVTALGSGFPIVTNLSDLWATLRSLPI